MRGMTLEAITRVCGGTYTGPGKARKQEITSIVRDNRQVEEGGLFVAIKGARVDGNRFVPAAYEAGALCCLSESAPEDLRRPYIKVKSYRQALADLAAYYRGQYPVRVIGITGSVGKTTTKEMLASVLSQHYCTLKTQGNYNNLLGLPLTLFRLREEHEVAIVEMGISDFGEMKKLTAMARPDLCVITNIGQCHLENLGDRDGVLRAKTEIFEGLQPGGKAYLNGDDDKLRTIREVNGQKPIFFGLQQDNAVYPKKMVSKGLSGTEMEVATPKGDFTVHVPLPGRHMITNALAAVAVGLDQGLSAQEIARGIEAFRPVDGHSSIFATEHVTVMDDCYNANPVSMKAGIDVLAEAVGRKVAILGDMFELGREEEAMHYDIGRYAAVKDLDVIIAIGELAKQYRDGVYAEKPQQKIFYYETLEDALQQLAEHIREGDSILVKASHGMHFEKVVAQLREL